MESSRIFSAACPEDEAGASSRAGAANVDQRGHLNRILRLALPFFVDATFRERTQAGLAAARARGRRGGRPKSLDATKRAIAVNLYDEKKHSVKEICEVMGVSKPTLYKYIQAARTETT